jgi:hypothetical protein
METPHAVAFDEGNHVVFERGQVVGRGRHKLVAKEALYAVPEQAASGTEPWHGRNRLRFSKPAVHQYIFRFESCKAVKRATEALSPALTVERKAVASRIE